MNIDPNDCTRYHSKIRILLKYEISIFNEYKRYISHYSDVYMSFSIWCKFQTTPLNCLFRFSFNDGCCNFKLAEYLTLRLPDVIFYWIEWMFGNAKFNSTIIKISWNLRCQEYEWQIWNDLNIFFHRTKYVSTHALTHNHAICHLT